MNLFKGRTLPVLLAALVLVGGANFAVYAATGGNFRLGLVNKANRPSTLVNTGSGPALKLKTSLNAPPLAVNSKKVVKRLNADAVDGQHAKLVWQNIPLAAGWTGNCYTHTPQYAVQFGVVYLRGDLCDGATGTKIFTLPAAARPQRTHAGGSWLYIAVDQCNAATGRIYMEAATGDTYSESDPSAAAADSCFISLEGVSYTK